MLPTPQFFGRSATTVAALIPSAAEKVPTLSRKGGATRVGQPNSLLCRL